MIRELVAVTVAGALGAALIASMVCLGVSLKLGQMWIER